jgi:DNA-binding NarL/FixJ family response regulator
LLVLWVVKEILNPMTVLIVEESLLISGRIRNLLLETGNASNIYQTAEHTKAVTLFEEVKPQVVLLDMCMPGATAIDLLQDIKKAATETAIVVLVNCEDYQKQLKCTTIGVDFILDKYHEFEKLPEIMDSIVRKGNFKPSNEKPKHYTKLA